MRISDWSSDVCSSDLEGLRPDLVIEAETETLFARQIVDVILNDFGGFGELLRRRLLFANEADDLVEIVLEIMIVEFAVEHEARRMPKQRCQRGTDMRTTGNLDRKSTRLNSSH